MTALGYRVYKEGAYPNVTLKVGSDYVALEFKEDKDATVVIATQYVANNIETYVDKVILHDRDITNQEWLGPSLSDEESLTSWFFNQEVYSVKLTKNAVAYINNHRHTICGNDVADTVAHYNGEIHTELVNYTMVKDEAGLEYNLSTGKQKYFALATNVEITKTFEFASGSSICLNGYTLKIAKGAGLLNVKTGEHITITDCKINSNIGTITRSENSISEADSKNHMIEVTNGVVNIYNIEVKDMEVSSASKTDKQTFLYVTGIGKVVVENSVFDNNTVEDVSSLVGIYGKTAKLQFASVRFINNNIRGINSAFFTLYDAAESNMVVSTISFIGNTADHQLINVVGKDTAMSVEQANIRNNRAIGIARLIAFDSSHVFRGSVDISDNDIRGVFYATGSDAYAILASYSTVGLTDTLLYVGNGAKVTLKGENYIMYNNPVNGKPIIYVDKGGTLYLSDFFYIDNNNMTSPNPVNVYVASGAYISSKFAGQNAIASGSVIRFTVESPEQEVFRYWNKDYIEEFNNFEAYEVYLHDRIFKLDGGDIARGYAVYKKGTDSEVSLNVGREYSTLVFRTGDDPSDIIATQYVAKNVKTYVDKIMLRGVDEHNQLWGGPDDDDNTKNVNCEL